MRARARLGGLVAAAGVATLVVPLAAMVPAEAAPTTDLSITKTVRVLGDTVIDVPDDFDPTWGDTRATGGYELAGSGLRVWTGPNNPGFTNKAAEYVDTDTPLATIAAGADPTLSYTALPNDNASNQRPGFQLVTDLNGDGTVDGILVGEQSNAGKWWLGRYKGQPALDPAIVAAAPHPAGGGGPSQGPWGTLDEWTGVGAFANARVVAFGFSLGSNSGQNNGVISAINFNGTSYTFGGFGPSVQAAPGATVEYRLTVANGATGADATGVRVDDVLPADLTYVPGSLRYSGPAWCSVTDQTLACTGGTLPAGSSAKIWFKATVSDTVSSAGLGSTIGHHVDVQKQEVFADLTAGQTKSFTVLCPAGYVPTDGGLLVDAVDQGGYYSDIVIAKSAPTTVGGVRGWLVKASNLGEQRGQGKVKVTCLGGSVGSANGHAHDVVVTASTGSATILASSADSDGEPVTVACPAGYTPVAPQHTVTSGIAVIRSSYASGNTWTWMVDHEVGTAASFDVSCLAPETTSSNGHTATLPITTSSYTISVAPDSRDEGVVQCGQSKNGIVGGYDGEDAELLSLGKEARGNNYMFRFFNDDWGQSWNADLSVTCVGVRTADEPVYYHIRNTATISSPAADASTADNSSTADIAIVGDAVQPAGGVQVGPTVTLTGSAPNVKKVNLQMACTSACAFTVKVLKNGNVVAKATKSFPGSNTPFPVAVPTLAAGKSLATGNALTVKVKTSTGTTSTDVTVVP